MQRHSLRCRCTAVAHFSWQTWPWLCVGAAHSEVAAILILVTSTPWCSLSCTGCMSYCFSLLRSTGMRTLPPSPLIGFMALLLCQLVSYRESYFLVNPSPRLHLLSATSSPQIVLLAVECTVAVSWRCHRIRGAECLKIGSIAHSFCKRGILAYYTYPPNRMFTLTKIWQHVREQKASDEP